MSYNLNPDFRRQAPNTGDYCTCCQKPIKDGAKAVPVTINWETWEVAEGHNAKLSKDQSCGNDNLHIGATCWQKIKKRPWA